MPISVLTPQERRVIANLSIPRNVLNLTHELRSDPHSGVGETFDVPAHLAVLEQEGFVVNLGGEHESPGKLAAAMDSHERAIGLPDEKAALYERRLLVPHRHWRWQGEQWVMTGDGFDKLHQHEGVGDPAPLETAVVQRIVDEQARRIHEGDITEDTRLSSHPDPGDLRLTRMLGDEFAAWFEAVAAGHERLTGERLRPPVAGGAGYADATELLILDPENGKGSAYTETAPWFMAAVTVAITDADTGSTITEANYTGYARKSVAAADMNTAAAGAATNANAITFAACTALTSAVIGFGKCVALTVGRLIKYGTCATVNVSSTQTPLSFAAAAFSTTLD